VLTRLHFRVALFVRDALIMSQQMASASSSIARWKKISVRARAQRVADRSCARTVVQGDLVLAHCRVFGRHAGDSLGAPATNNVVEFWGMALVRVEHDRIVEGWNCFDFLSMYQQLGWVKNPPIPVA
jgi:predicted ester cyclase